MSKCNTMINGQFTFLEGELIMLWLWSAYNYFVLSYNFKPIEFIIKYFTSVVIWHSRHKKTFLSPHKSIISWNPALTTSLASANSLASQHQQPSWHQYPPWYPGISILLGILASVSPVAIWHLQPSSH